MRPNFSDRSSYPGLDAEMTQHASTTHRPQPYERRKIAPRPEESGGGCDEGQNAPQSAKCTKGTIGTNDTRVQTEPLVDLCSLLLATTVTARYLQIIRVPDTRPHFPFDSAPPCKSSVFGLVRLLSLQHSLHVQRRLRSLLIHRLPTKPTPPKLKLWLLPSPLPDLPVRQCRFVAHTRTLADRSHRSTQPKATLFLMDEAISQPEELELQPRAQPGQEEHGQPSPLQAEQALAAE